MTISKDPAPDSTKVPEKRRVLVLGFAVPNMIEMLARLAEDRNWEIVYWIGPDPLYENSIRSRFSGVQLHDKWKAVRGEFPAGVPVGDWPRRDPDVVRRLAIHDPVLHSVFLRQARTFMGLDQMAEYHETITQWYYFFRHVSPDLVIYDQIPALVYDYVAYLLCGESGIPSLLLLRPMQVPGMILPTNRYEEPAPRVVESYRDLMSKGSDCPIRLRQEMETLWSRMNGTYEQAMYKGFAQRYAIDRSGDRVKLRGNMTRKACDVIRRIRDGRPYRPYLRALAAEIRTLPRRLRLRWSYARYAKEPDYDVPYVFVPLHVQPERTSVPQGGIFGHQLLMVEILSRSLPKGWLLYVKEHPVQLYSRPASRFFRTSDFYRELARFDNVRLVPSRVSARKLIRHCRSVASATSTACWEAIFQNRPALVFGDVFFTFFEGVFHVKSEEECARAFESIRNGYRPNESRLRAGLYAIQEQGLPMPQLASAGKIGQPETEGMWAAWLDRARTQIDENGWVISGREDAPRTETPFPRSGNGD